MTSANSNQNYQQTVKQSIHHSFDIELAKEYGVEGALLIHHFMYWVSFNHRLKRNFKDGRTWTYQTRKELAAHFPYWTEDQVRRYTDNLVKKGVLVKGNYNRHQMDKTIWYAFENEDFLSKNDPPSQSESQETHTTGKFANSSGENANRAGKSAKAIPDTKTQMLKPDDYKINEESLLRSPKPKKKDFTRSLDEHQKKAFEKVMKTVPEWGDRVKPTDVTYWLLKLKGGGAKRVEEALEVYLQDVPKAKEAGRRIESMGAYMRSVLDSGRKPNHEHFDRNRTYAEEVAGKNKFIRPKQQYVTIDSYINECVLYSLPESTFKQTIDSYVNKCREYECNSG